MSPTHPRTRLGLPSRATSNAGVAIVLVLIFMALITGLIVSFFISASSELTSAKGGADAGSAKQLADSAVQAAMSSVREATTLVPNPTSAATVSAPWASQPGMIRTYDPATGVPLKYYKLYSSDSMVVSTPPLTGYDSSTDVDPTWDTKPGLYTDLNSPVTGSDGAIKFPIIDPRAYNGVQDAVIQGFSYSPMTPSNSSGTAIDGVVLTPGDTQRLPMPTKWLYVLADGSLHSAMASTGSSTSVTINPNVVNGISSGPTSSNPIVGRVAYWTDDETCKVNVNTASEANNKGTAVSTSTSVWKTSFWDTPHFNTPIEQNMASFQPATGEYQRYPGHPATVDLTGILKGLTSQSILKPMTAAPYITPRYAYGGSQDGTVLWTSAVPVTNLPYDRLYATMDDIIFDPLRNTDNSNTSLLTKTQVNAARFFLTTTSRASELNLFGLPRVAVWPIHYTNDAAHRTAIDQLISFCSSTGPVLTGNTTPQFPFYFTRLKNADSSYDIHLDRNVALLKYLDALTNKKVPVVPGATASFGAKYSGNTVSGAGTEKGQILTEIFDYIRGTNTGDSKTTVPYGQPSAGLTGTGYKFGAGQVTPSSVLTDETTLPASMQDSQGFGARFYRISEATLHFAVLGQGKTPTNAVGYPVPAGQQGTHVKFGTTDWTGSTPPAFSNAVQAYFLLDFVTPSAGMAGTMPYGNLDPSTFNSAFHEAFYAEVLGLNNLALTISGVATNMGFPASDSMFLGPGNYGGGVSKALQRGSTVNFMDPVAMMAGRMLGTSATIPDPTRRNPFYSALLPVAFNATTMTINSAGPITVNLYSCAGTSSSGTYPDKGQLVQSIQLNFCPSTAAHPSTTYAFRAPVINLSASSGYDPGGAPITGIGTGTSTDRWFYITQGVNNFTPGDDYVQGPDPGYSGAPPASDVARSLVLDDKITKGDLRLFARPALATSSGTPNPPLNYYIPHETNSGGAVTVDYNNSSFFRTDSNRSGYSAFYTNDGSTTKGKLAQGTTNDGTFAPAVPVHLNGAFIANSLYPTSTTIPGDWDNGTSILPDGPWINQPDEGNGESVSTGDIPYFALAQDRNIPTFFSPNRMIPSPVMLGSLSTGVKRQLPWQTLLFRPGPAYHPGNPSAPAAATGTDAPDGTDPADHYLLDLFWMPTAEPYAISEPFATAGKINLNQQIVPFTYIARYTGLMAALTGERVAEMPATAAGIYKTYTMASSLVSRWPINLKSTASNDTSALRDFKEKFASGDIFRSASQICEVFLPPDDGLSLWTSDYIARSDPNIGWYGPNFALVGDNVRERLYADIYNKVTTKSNSYTVHYWVQPLRKSLNSNPAVFDTSKGDQVVGEQRGATTFERYLDGSTITADPAVVNASGSYQSLEPYYRLRTQSSRVFTP